MVAVLPSSGGVTFDQQRAGGRKFTPYVLLLPGMLWLTVFFLFPMAIAIMYLSWPVCVNALKSGEMSSNAGGLMVWPARALVPLGFLLLILQGASEAIKRLARESEWSKRHDQPFQVIPISADMGVESVEGRDGARW